MSLPFLFLSLLGGLNLLSTPTSEGYDMLPSSTLSITEGINVWGWTGEEQAA